MSNNSFNVIHSLQTTTQLLSHLYPHHHVEVPLTVLLYNIPDIVRLPSLLEFPPRHKIFYLPDGPDRVLVCLGESAMRSSSSGKLPFQQILTGGFVLNERTNEAKRGWGRWRKLSNELTVWLWEALHRDHRCRRWRLRWLCLFDWWRLRHGHFPCRLFVSCLVFLMTDETYIIKIKWLCIMWNCIRSNKADV